MIFVRVLVIYHNADFFVCSPLRLIQNFDDLASFLSWRVFCQRNTWNFTIMILSCYICFVNWGIYHQFKIVWRQNWVDLDRLIGYPCSLFHTTRRICTLLADLRFECHLIHVIRLPAHVEFGQKVLSRLDLQLDLGRPLWYFHLIAHDNTLSIRLLHRRQRLLFLLQKQLFLLLIIMKNLLLLPDMIVIVGTDIFLNNSFCCH